jgi:hypothetical protein
VGYRGSLLFSSNKSFLFYIWRSHFGFATALEGLANCFTPKIVSKYAALNEIAAGTVRDSSYFVVLIVPTVLTS